MIREKGYIASVCDRLMAAIDAGIQDVLISDLALSQVAPLSQRLNHLRPEPGFSLTGKPMPSGGVQITWRNLRGTRGYVLQQEYDPVVRIQLQEQDPLVRCAGCATPMSKSKMHARSNGFYCHACAKANEETMNERVVFSFETGADSNVRVIVEGTLSERTLDALELYVAASRKNLAKAPIPIDRGREHSAGE